MFNLFKGQREDAIVVLIAFLWVTGIVVGTVAEIAVLVGGLLSIPVLFLLVYVLGSVIRSIFFDKE